MATKRWRGDAPAVAQVTTVTISGYDASTTYKVTINGKVVSVAGSGGTTSTTATALQAALAASTIPEFLEVTWTVNTNVVTGTAATAGVPFTLAVSVSGGTGTISTSTTTTSSGPNDWNVAANWDSSGVPTTGDTVYFDTNDVDCLYNLDQNTVTLAALHVLASYTGNIGLRTYNESEYYEYRETYLKIGATTACIGKGSGTGSGRIRLNVGSVQCSLFVWGSGIRDDEQVPALLWIGSSSTNMVNLYRGDVGIAALNGESATIHTLRVLYVNSPRSDVRLVVGGGASISNYTGRGGDVSFAGSIPASIGGGDIGYGSGFDGGGLGGG